MTKSLCTKIAQKNYYDMSSHFKLKIDKKKSRELIKSTHGFCGFWKYHPYVIKELIEDCQDKMYKGEDALNYINSNFKQKVKKITYEIESKIIGSEKPNLSF